MSFFVKIILKHLEIISRWKKFEKMKRSHGYVWPWARTPRAYSRGWGGVQPLNAALVFFYHFWFLFLFFNFFILVDIKIYTHIFCEFLNENFNLKVEICFFLNPIIYIYNSLNVLKLLRFGEWKRRNEERRTKI